MSTPTTVAATASVDAPTISTSSWLRFSNRHIHATVVDYLTTQLDALDWLEAAPPLGANPVTLQTYLPKESELKDIQAGTVAVTLGDEDDAVDEELGGPLHSQDLPIFIDIFQERDGHALSLASDIRDIFRGRLSGTRRSMPVLDWTDDPATPVSGWRMEFQDVIRERVDRAPLQWQSVKITCHVEFPEEIY